MSLHFETISEKIGDIAKLIHDKCSPDFYLAGGTALALQIGHRKSIDLDYFIAKPINTLKFTADLKEIFDGLDFRVTFEAKNTLWCQIDGIKVSFISRFDNLYEPAIRADYFRLASLKDITLMKLSAICSREEYKDYFDLACLAKATDSRSWVSWWGTVYAHVDITGFIVALAAVRQVPQIPLEIMSEYKNLNVISVIENLEKDITKAIKEA